MKKTVLITGASSGFGLLIANKLHENGYTVIGTSRRPGSVKVPFKMLELDLSDDQSIQSFSTELFRNINRLDVLVNNAGYYLAGLAEETSIEQGLAQFDTNFWGTVKLTNSLLPYFRKQKAGTILTVGSITGLINFPNAAYYGASKHALEGYFKSLRFELQEFNIKVAMVEPMGFKTSILGNSINAENKLPAYDGYRQKIERFSKSLFENAPEPTPVIKTLMNLIEAADPKFSNPVGKGASLILAIQHFSYKTFEKSILKNINKTKTA